MQTKYLMWKETEEFRSQMLQTKMICCGGGKTELTQAQTCQEVQNQDVRVSGIHWMWISQAIVRTAFCETQSST